VLVDRPAVEIRFRAIWRERFARRVL